MTTPTDPDLVATRDLVVVGAVAGVAKWFCEHVLGTQRWDCVHLIDTSPTVATADLAVTAHRVTRSLATDIVEALPVGPDAVVVVGVPLDTLPSVVSWLAPAIPHDATVIDLSHDRVRAELAYGERTTVGVHALFGITAPNADGQTFAVCGGGHAADWTAATIESAGGTVNRLTAQRHDEIMRVVQTATHQALLSFADVVGRSGLDVEQDLWANRTPLFEVVLSLASRVLTPGQEATSASIQIADDGSTIRALTDANDRLRAAREQGDMNSHLSALREPFPGALFTKLQQVGALATSSALDTRARISQRRRSGELIGVRSTVGSDRLHVGRIERVSATSFTLEDLLVGKPGQAALLTDDAAAANARKLGIGGKPRRVEFRLGRVSILTPDELEAELDTWLPTVTRGTKLLVPESISGASAVEVVRSIRGVEHAELVSEEVRLGQREIVAKFRARLDRDLDTIERSIERRVDEVFVWPDGVVLPVRAQGAIGFLGPAGTFSDTAARQLGRLAANRVDRVELSGFPQIVDALTRREIALAPIPIANSSSGLVDLAAAALLDAASPLAAGGVVDVLVRFDAYVAPGKPLQHGDTVYTHPQVLRQCSQFISAHGFEVVECSSTVDACQRVASQGHGVAIANVGLGADVGLELARASVGNLAGAVTRFLVVGAHDAFAPSPRADATLRSVWIASSAAGITASSTPHFDEVLVGPSGAMLLVSTDPDRLPHNGPGLRHLGSLPWSPRTPVVLIG